MESRRAIRYRRNTLDHKHDKKEVDKRRDVPIKKLHDHDRQIVDQELKVFATLECVWCGNAFDEYEIRCRVCGNCQFCGLVCPDREGCMQCGNHLPEEIKPIKLERSIKVSGKIKVEE